MEQERREAEAHVGRSTCGRRSRCDRWRRPGRMMGMLVQRKRVHHKQEMRFAKLQVSFSSSSSQKVQQLQQASSKRVESLQRQAEGGGQAIDMAETGRIGLNF